MGVDAVVGLLAKRLSELGKGGSKRTLASTGKGRKSAAAAPSATVIASQLVSEALRNGLTLGGASPSTRNLSGGNTAMQVSLASAEVSFVFKMDNNAKLIREARTIEDLRSDVRLGTFCSRLPRVYSQYASGPPYAYLMEWFDGKTYPSIKEIFFGDRDDFPSAPHATEIVRHAVDALAEAWRGSRDDRMQVRLMGEAYYQRIESNLTKAAEKSPEYMPLPLSINGRQTRSWRDCLDTMRAHEEKLQSIAAPFVTVVHGDPNPGNILIKRSGDKIRDVKFIDVKDWKYGDYLFDLAKLAHFLLHTGPLEQLQALEQESVDANGPTAVFNFRRAKFNHVDSAAKAIEESAEKLALELQDPHWKLRYTFAMASNLLGLIPGRMGGQYVNEALILYAEGMLLLDQFISEWQQAGGTHA
jgi:serine/threonine protein kinase